MATNLVSLISQYLTPDLISRIATSYGFGEETAQKAATATVPAMLACIGSAASKAGGERLLGTALNKAPIEDMHEMASIVGSTSEPSLTDAGIRRLSGLLGPSVMDSLVRSMSQYAGISQTNARTLTGLMASMVLGGLRKHQVQSGMDTSGLVNQMAGQKTQFTRAIPNEMAELMKSNGLGESLSDSPGAKPSLKPLERPTKKEKKEQAMAPKATEDTRGGSWAYLVIGVLLVGGLVWVVMGDDTSERQLADAGSATQQESMAMTEAETPAAEDETLASDLNRIEAGGVDLAERLTVSLDNLGAALSSISNPATARSALPELRDTLADIDVITDLSQELPDDNQQRLAQMVEDAMPDLEARMDDTLTDPSISAITKPLLDDLKARLGDLRAE